MSLVEEVIAEWKTRSHRACYEGYVMRSVLPSGPYYDYLLNLPEGAVDEMCTLTIGRFWPRWLCWLLGHEPTEVVSPDRITLRCRCGSHEDGSFLRHRQRWALLIKRIGAF
jgi:hypothetical protein